MNREAAMDARCRCSHTGREHRWVNYPIEAGMGFTRSYIPGVDEITNCNLCACRLFDAMTEAQ